MLVYVTNECSTANNRHFGAHLAHIILPHLTQPLHTSPPLANPPNPIIWTVFCIRNGQLWMEKAKKDGRIVKHKGHIAPLTSILSSTAIGLRKHRIPSDLRS